MNLEGAVMQLASRDRYNTKDILNKNATQAIDRYIKAQLYTWLMNTLVGALSIHSMDETRLMYARGAV